MTCRPASDVRSRSRAADHGCGRARSARRTSAIVLGSGLGDFADTLDDACRMPYGDLPHWPASSVIGHAGQAGRSARSRGKRVAALAGRAHLYEGHDLRTVDLRRAGAGACSACKTLILTNAAGGINTAFAQGALMVIDDHINLMGGNPLIGANDERFGPRFPDMTEVYSPRLRALADEAARGGRRAAGARRLRRRCTVRATRRRPRSAFLRTIGADAVGMSTVPEAIAARHMGIEVLGISCITNMAAGVLPQPLDHDEVMETARAGARRSSSRCWRDR